jgi:hypothetical protein
LKSRAESKDSPLRTPQKKSRDSVTVADIREMLLSEPREQAPVSRTKSSPSKLSPSKPHSWNAKAEEFEPGRRSHGCVGFVPGAISHGLMSKAGA